MHGLRAHLMAAANNVRQCLPASQAHPNCPVTNNPQLKSWISHKVMEGTIESMPAILSMQAVFDA